MTTQNTTQNNAAPVATESKEGMFTRAWQFVKSCLKSTLSFLFEALDGCFRAVQVGAAATAGAAVWLLHEVRVALAKVREWAGPAAEKAQAVAALEGAEAALQQAAAA